eukprot:725935-Rhodomonas_salina.1
MQSSRGTRERKDMRRGTRGRKGEEEREKESETDGEGAVLELAVREEDGGGAAGVWLAPDVAGVEGTKRSVPLVQRHTSGWRRSHACRAAQEVEGGRMRARQGQRETQAPRAKVQQGRRGEGAG